MKKTGTLTFHWANNYGAVMQAYALQKHLLNCGYDTEIIDYYPLRNRLSMLKNSILRRRFSELKKARLIAAFRKENLLLSKRRYGSFKALKACSDAYSDIIVGSDQVWNTNFTCHGEGGPALSYFLAFASGDTGRIAYAVSFGTEKVDDAYAELTREHVRRFRAIGVRERTGVDIIRGYGIEPELVCDPTILLEAAEYEGLTKVPASGEKLVFPYILHDGQSLSRGVLSSVKEAISRGCFPEGILSVEEWLGRIKSARIVVTNSYHGMLFALLFHTPFIVVPVEGAKMNDRISTVLSAVGLEERFVSENDKKKIARLCEEEIDWASVDKALGKMRAYGRDYLKRSLKKD